MGRSTSTMFREVEIALAGERLLLLPSKLAWWPAERTLFMADSHFGKANHFRLAGLPVPGGTTQAMLQALSTELTSRSAQRLIVLGDLTHAAVGSTQDWQAELDDWRAGHRSLVIVLLKGNHDRCKKSFYERMAIEICDRVDPPSLPFSLYHDPQMRGDSRAGIGGHVHPGYRIPAVAARPLPCFWLHRDHLVMPAFGRFTGLKSIRLDSGDMAYVICDNQIAAIASDRSHSM